MDHFIKQANQLHATFKFTAEITSLETIHPGHKNHYKSTETFQSVHTSSHAGKNAGFIKDEAMRLFRTNVSKTFQASFEEFQQRLRARARLSKKKNL